MKMGYRNFKTQEIWLFEENFMKVEKKKKKNITPRDPLRDLKIAFTFYLFMYF